MAEGGMRGSGMPWARARFDWLKSVRSDGALSPIARLLAHELALGVANMETGQCNPGPASLAARLGCGEKTIKRAMAELVAARCIRRDGSSGGKGKTASITFLARAETDAIKPANTGSELSPFIPQTGTEMTPYNGIKRGQNCPPLGRQTGSELSAKRGQNCPPNHRREPYTRADTHTREAAKTSAAATQGEGRDQVRTLLAEKIRQGRYVPSSAVGVSMAQNMLRLGEVEAHQLRSAGIAF